MLFIHVIENNFITKNVLRTEDNAHINHQNIPQTMTEYSQGTSAETIKTTGKQETIHSPANCNQKAQPKL